MMFRFEPLGFAERAGRVTQRARATVRNSDEHTLPASLRLVVQRGADDYELDVDVERGVVLRIAACRNRLPFWVREIVSLRLDEPISAECFAFEPPPDHGVLTPRQLHGEVTFHRPLHEAVGRMPFKVFVPREVPAERDLSVTARGASEHHPANLILWYQSGEGPATLTVGQSSAATAAAAVDYPSDLPAWEERDCDGLTVKVRQPCEQSPIAALICEHEGTKIEMTSPSLDTDTRVRLASTLAVVDRRAEPR